MVQGSYAQRLPFIGDWAILGRLGGGPSHILRAAHMSTGEVAVVKVTNPSEMREAERGLEAHLHRLCSDHPNVLTLTDVVRVSTKHEPTPNQSEFNYVAARRQSAAGRRRVRRPSTHKHPHTKTRSRSLGRPLTAESPTVELECLVMPRGKMDLAALMKGTRNKFTPCSPAGATAARGDGAAAIAAGDGDGDGAAAARAAVHGQPTATAPDVENALPQAAAWRYARQLLQALAHVHAQGVVHNDVKLENVVLSSDTNTAQLMDFGLSTLAAADPDDQIASFVGTYAYMAPEVLNQRGRGAAADLWSFGVSLFKMLTGRMPFRHGTLGELIADIESEAYTTVMAEEMASRAYSDGDKEHAEATTTTTTTTTTTFHPRSSSSSSNAGNAGNAAQERPASASMHATRKSARRSSSAAAAVRPAMNMKVLELFAQLFHSDPNARPTAADLLASDWFGNVGVVNTSTTTKQTNSSADDASSTFSTHTTTQTSASGFMSETTDDSYIPAAARLEQPSPTLEEKYTAAAAAAALLPPVRLGKEVSPPFADEIDRLETRLKTARALQSPQPRLLVEAKTTVERLAKEQVLLRSTKSDSTLYGSAAAAAAASHGGGVHDELDHNGRLRRRAVSASDIARAPWPKELLEKVHAERVRIREAIAAQSADLAETRRERKFAEAAEARTATNPRPKAARHTAKRATMMLQRKKQRSPKLHRTKIQTLSSNTNLPALSRVAGRPFH